MTIASTRRVTLRAPCPTTPRVARAALARALPPSRVPGEAQVAAWTDLELALAHDWAARERGAGGPGEVHRRPRPSFVAPPPGPARTPMTRGEVAEEIRQLVRTTLVGADVDEVSRTLGDVVATWVARRRPEVTP